MSMEKAKRDGYYAKDGLLYHKEEGQNYIPLPVADEIARAYGYIYVERLVKDLQKSQEEIRP